MKYGKVYKLSDLFDLYLLVENGNEDLLTYLFDSTLKRI